MPTNTKYGGVVVGGGGRSPPPWGVHGSAIQKDETIHIFCSELIGFSFHELLESGKDCISLLINSINRLIDG